jgi:hypothetical protein
VAPLAVVEALDVFLYGGLCVGSRGVALMMYQLVFKAPQKLSIVALS